MDNSPLHRPARIAVLPALLLPLVAASTGLSGQPTAAPAGGEHWPHTVLKGDTLIGLARERLVPGADWRTVQRLNGVRNPLRLVPGSTLLVPWNLLPATATPAVVQHVHREVWIGRGRDGIDNRRAASAGDTVRSGETIEVGAQSSASLRLAEGTRILLRPQTRLVVEVVERQGGGDAASAGRYVSRLRVLSGGIEAQAPLPQRLDVAAAPGAATALSGARTSLGTPVPGVTTTAPTWRQLQIRTPVANLGVRGTVFRTRADAATAWFEVVEGEVRTAAGDGSTVGPSAASEQPLGPGLGQVATALGLQTPARLLPAPRLPPGGTLVRVAGQPLALAWAADDDVRVWQVQLLAHAAAPTAGTAAQRPVQEPTLVLEARVAEPRASWPDAVASTLPEGRYEWRVRALDAQGLEGQTAILDTTLVQQPAPPPVPPTPTRRVSGAPVLQAAEYTSDGVLLRWAGRLTLAESAPGQRWRVQRSTQADFASGVTADVLTDQASLLLAGLSAGRWHWRVRAERSDGPPCVGGWSAVQAFDLHPPWARWWWAPGGLTLLDGAAPAGGAGSDLDCPAMPGSASR
jgi:hypothetical protein